MARRADVVLAAFAFQHVNRVLFNCISDALFEPKDELTQHKDYTPKILSQDGKWTTAYIWIIVGYDNAAAAAIIMLELNFS